MQMHRRTEQNLHGFRPKSLRIQVDHCLQIAQLMGHTQLSLPGWSFYLGRVDVRDPYFDFMLSHDFFDYIHAAVEASHMQDRFRRTEDPLIPVLGVHPAAGLVRMDHDTAPDRFLNRLGLLEGFLPSPLGDLVDRPFTQLHSVQVRQGLLRAFIAHVLLLPIVHYRRFQACPKGPFHFQPFGWFASLFLTAAGACHLKLAYFDHFGFRFRQFSDLSSHPPTHHFLLKGHSDNARKPTVSLP